MNKTFTLIYQFSSLKNKKPIVFDLQQLLKDEEEIRQELQKTNRFVLKSPPIEVLQKN